ncbi:MAG TPA: nuclease-related domain-containing protein [Candidatus Angelobacter sp.]|nr:nuclease-related domain-containing protein [Candidatus Angelobacter sp.]
MAQLVKCFDFVSRYEINLSRYISQFAAIRRKRWEAFQKEGVAGNGTEAFFNDLYPHQLTWASSTSLRRSKGANSLKKDESLKNLLSWFGDASLLLYHPVLKIEGVETELDSILVTPFSIYVIHYLEGEKGSVFQGRSKRQWAEIRSEEERLLVNPLISLARSTELVARSLQGLTEGLSLKPVLLVPNSFVEFADPGRGVQIIDQTHFSNWLKTMEPYRAPVKNNQLKVVEVLLRKAMTRAESR